MGASATDGWRPGEELTPVEECVLQYAAAGDVLDVGPAGDWPGGDASTGRPELDAMQAWGPERTIRAAVLRHLLVSDQWAAHVKGVRVRGARISGELDLEGCAIRVPLRLWGCYFEGSEAVRLDYATVTVLALTGCHLPAVCGESLTVTKGLDLSGSALTGPLRLTSAEIAGHVLCRGTQLNAAELSLAAERIKVAGDFSLDAVDEWTRFQAAGALVLNHAEISGSLSCTAAELGADEAGNSLLAEGIKIGGHIRLTADPEWYPAAFTAAGAIRISGATIESSLDCTGAWLATASEGADEHFVALEAQRVTVNGNLVLDRLQSPGAVVLSDAKIAGDFSCSEAIVHGTDDFTGHAFKADFINVGGSVGLDEGFTADGTVLLIGADIAGHLICQGARLKSSDNEYNALVADHITVGGSVRLDYSPESMDAFRADGGVRLAGAEIRGQLVCSGAWLGQDGDANSLVGDGMKVARDAIAGIWTSTILGWAFATLAVAGYTGLVRRIDGP